MFILDLAAKIDQCAEYMCKQQWGDLEFPPPFGREAFPEVMLCLVVTHRTSILLAISETMYLFITSAVHSHSKTAHILTQPC